MATKKTAAEPADVTVTEENTQKSDTRAIIPKKIDLPEYVVVKNGFHGKLVYQSRRTGEVYIWDQFGDEQEMELRDLRDAKNSAKDFFANNWFIFDEDWIPDYLGVRQFYRDVIRVEDFDKIFDKEPNEMKEYIKALSDSQKASILYRASELINSGVIDSRKKIAALEDALGVEMIER